MAGTLTTYSCNKLLDHTYENTAYTPVASVWLGMSTTLPTAAGGNITEPTYTGYARKQITFDAAASRAIVQAEAIAFDACTAGSATVPYWVIFDSQTAGGSNNALAFGDFAASKNIVAGSTPTIADQGITITIGANLGVSTYLAHKWLDFMFRNQAFTQPNVHVALWTATLADASTGATAGEVANSNNYARVDFNGWSAASSGALQNESAVTYPTPTGSWGTVVSMATFDSATHGAGNILHYGNNVVDQSIGSGDPVDFSTGAIDWVQA
jgi:hypothetical protein